ILVAIKMIEDKGGLIDRDGWEQATAAEKCKNEKGSLVRTDTSPPTPAPDCQELPACPTDDELRVIYNGTAFGTFVDAVFKTEPRIRPILAITGALVMQSLLLTRCIRVRGKKPNVYAGLVACPAKGKGTVARAIQTFIMANGMEAID